MVERFPIGDVARLHLDIITSNAGVTEQAPIVAIQRAKDGKWFDGTVAWQDTPVDNPMVETNLVHLPGRYHFDFDQALDQLKGSRAYSVRIKNPVSGANARVVYQDIEFGPMSAATLPDLCAVMGNVLTLQGEPAPGVLVRATLQPVYKDGAGRIVQTQLVQTYTDATGFFSLSLVRGVTARLEVESVGYDRKVIIPDQASVVFTDL